MKRIALVGTAPSRVHAPYDDATIEIWGVGNRHKEVKRADRWFELHRIDGEERDWQVEWRKAMKEWPQDAEVWMFYPEPDLGKKVVHFDPKNLVAKYGTFFMTSSFSWMMAQAIEEILATKEQGEILLFGVDMEYGTEYREQRTGLRHFIELAKLFSIKITRVASSGLAYEPIPYPFWQDDPLLTKLNLRANWIKEHTPSLKKNAEMYQSIIDQNKGIIQVLTEMKAAEEFDIDARIEMTKREIESGIERLHECEKTIAKHEGTSDEQDWLRDYLMP